MKDKIYKWLNEQGYPLEFKVANELRNNGFTVIQSEFFKDPDTAQNREIDVVAFKQFYTPKLLIRLTIVVECKSGKKKPWILFSSPDSVLSDADKVVQTPGTEIGKMLLRNSQIFSKYKDLEIFSTNERTSFGITECFTTGKDIPYSALTSVAKATAAFIDKESAFKESNICDIIFPFVVIEAPLFESYYDGELVIDKVESGTLAWRNRIIDQQQSIIRVQRFELFKRNLKSYGNDFDLILDYIKEDMISRLNKLIAEKAKKIEIR